MLTCSDHLKLLAIFTPRHVQESTWSKMVLFSWYMRVVGLERAKVMMSHFRALNAIPHSRLHRSSAFRSFCSWNWSSSEWISLYTKQSSANSLHLVSGSRLTWRSLIKSKKRTGPKTVPFGTPDVSFLWILFLQKHLLRPTWEKWLDPGVDVAVNTVMMEFTEELFLRNLVKGLAEV